MGKDLTVKVRFEFGIKFTSLLCNFEFQDFILDAPVLLVGNKCEQHDDRMVTVDEGHKRHKDIFCESFHEISVRESYEEVGTIVIKSMEFNFNDLYTTGVQCFRGSMQILASFQQMSETKTFQQ